MKKRLTSFSIYSCKDDNLVLMTTTAVFHFLKIVARSRRIYGKDPMEGSRSERLLVRAHEVRAYTAHLHVRQTNPPTAQASFRPKKARTFSFNFLIE